MFTVYISLYTLFVCNRHSICVDECFKTHAFFSRNIFPSEADICVTISIATHTLAIHILFVYQFFIIS